MSTLRQKMIDAMLVRGFAERTHRSYLDAITHLAEYYSRSPERLTVEEVQAYFLHLTKKKNLSPATCHLILNAVVFLYSKVLGQPDFRLSIAVPKRPQKIPELLSPQDVARILHCCKNLKHKALLSVCYGCGLRVSELANLRVKDIDSQQHLLRIEQGKGAKDRLVLLSDSLLKLLREYWQVYRPSSYLFASIDPRESLSISTIQKIFKETKNRATIKKVGGIHSLRHAYATHQLAAGMPVYQLQQLMGHSNIKTTLCYVHWVPRYQEGKGDDLIAALEVAYESQ